MIYFFDKLSAPVSQERFSTHRHC